MPWRQLSSFCQVYNRSETDPENSSSHATPNKGGFFVVI